MKSLGREHGLELVERVCLVIGDLPWRRGMIVPQAPLIGKGQVVRQKMRAAAVKAAANVIFRHVMTAQPHTRSATRSTACVAEPMTM